MKNEQASEQGDRKSMRSLGRTSRPPWGLVISSALLGVILSLGLTVITQPAAWSEVQAWLGLAEENLAAQPVASSPALATENARQSRLAAGTLAPNFTRPTLAGGPVTLADWRGQPVLINFWASWCVPCRQEMPDLVRLSVAHKVEGLVILAVNLTAQDTLPEINAFVKEMGLTFPVVLDTTGEVTTTAYRIPGLPSSVFIDRGGRITRIQLGAMTKQQMEEFVATILPGAPASKDP